MSFGGRSFNAVPESLKKFVRELYDRVYKRDVFGTHQLYSDELQKINERYYSNTPMPTATEIAAQANNDDHFLVLYREIQLRHSFATVKSTLSDALDAFQNYIDLFNVLLGQSEDPDIDLPNQWLFDMVSGFVNWFAWFSQYKAQMNDATTDERTCVSNNQHAWSAQTVLRYLHALVAKGRIPLQYNKTVVAGGEVSNMSRMLGYFGVLAVSRVHVLLGDFTTAVRVLDPIDLRKGSPLWRIHECQVSTFYSLGCAYFFLRRYSDAAKAFLNVVPTRQVAQNERQMANSHSTVARVHRIHAMLAIAVAVCPQRVQDDVKDQMRERFQDQYKLSQDGDVEAIRALLTIGSPRFVSASPPNFNDPMTNSETPTQHQIAVFLAELADRAPLLPLYNLMKHYSSIPLSKLAQLAERDPAIFQPLMLCLKHKSRSLHWSGHAPADGVWQVATDLDFFIKNGNVHITETTEAQQFGQCFISAINRTEHMIQDINQISL